MVTHPYHARGAIDSLFAGIQFQGRTLLAEKAFDTLDIADAEIVPAIAQNTLVAEAIEQRTDHRTGGPDKIGSFLLRDTKMLTEPMFTPLVESPGWLA